MTAKIDENGALGPTGSSQIGLSADVRLCNAELRVFAVRTCSFQNCRQQ